MIAGFTTESKGTWLENPSGVGSVNWSRFDNKGVKHIPPLKNVLFFPDSPLKVLSITALCKKYTQQLNDSHETLIRTQQFISIFT